MWKVCILIKWDITFSGTTEIEKKEEALIKNLQEAFLDHFAFDIFLLVEP